MGDDADDTAVVLDNPNPPDLEPEPE